MDNLFIVIFLYFYWAIKASGGGCQAGGLVGGILMILK